MPSSRSADPPLEHASGTRCRTRFHPGARDPRCGAADSQRRAGELAAPVPTLVRDRDRTASSRRSPQTRKKPAALQRVLARPGQAAIGLAAGTRISAHNHIDPRRHLEELHASAFSTNREDPITEVKVVQT